jgi:hypothetical protein
MATATTASAPARAGQRSQVEQFFRTLVLGDFEDQPQTAATIVAGLLSMVPGLDQVMDVRDIAANLYRINAAGGLATATPAQKVNLAFACFGAIPTIGSVVRTVLQPLWRERHLAKGLVNGGLEAIEVMLNMRKGGAVRWLRAELLARWPARVQEAIAQADAALQACEGLLTFLSTAGGFKRWLIPHSIQLLAREALPGMQAMRSQISATLQEAAEEIRLFLADLLGEQAAEAMMTLGAAAVQDSALTGSRSRQHARRPAHNAADPNTSGKDIQREKGKKVQGEALTEGAKSASPVHSTQARMRESFGKIAFQQTGLLGEHIVDCLELERLGGKAHWEHDDEKPMPPSAPVRKLNCDKRPVNLHPRDRHKVPHPGIDAVWQHDGKYTVTEAKARANSFALKATAEKFVPKTVKSKLSADEELLYALLGTSKSGEGDGKVLVQMSEDWVKDRASREGLDGRGQRALKRLDCDRRVVLVTFETPGAAAHVEALCDIQAGLPIEQVEVHETHAQQKVWSGRAIDHVAKIKEKQESNKKQTKKIPPKMDATEGQSSASKKAASKKKL